MQGTRFLLSACIALAATGCARQQQAYVLDPATGRPAAMSQPGNGERGLLNAWQTTPQPRYAQATYAYVPPQSAPPVPAQRPAAAQGLPASNRFASAALY